MSYGRAESFLGHVHRHPARIWLRTGATRDGTLVAIRGRIVVDGGAFASSSPAVIGNATTFLAGPYEVPNALLEGTAVYTNNPPCGAMRGFGAPQVCFAHEANMDRLAAILGDRSDRAPAAQRRRAGLRAADGPGDQRDARRSREVIERCRAMPMPPGARAAPRCATR